MLLEHSFYCSSNAGWMLHDDQSPILRDKYILEFMKLIREFDDRLVLSPEHSIKEVMYSLPGRSTRVSSEVPFLTRFEEGTLANIVSYELRSSGQFVQDPRVTLKTDEKHNSMSGIEVTATLGMCIYGVGEDPSLQNMMLTLERAAKQHYGDLRRLEKLTAD